MQASKPSNYNRLKANLDYLKLKQIDLHLDEILDSKYSHLSIVDALLKLTDYEVDVKRQNSITAMVRIAKIPAGKTVDNFDFSFQESIEEREIRNLMTLSFIENKENIVFVGSSGVGKTHLAAAIGLEAATNGYSTQFIKCSELLEKLRKAHAEKRLENSLKYYNRSKLLIIDELGYLPLNPGDERLLFQVIDRRYEKKSTVLTTNIPFASWDELFNDALVAHAILDRVLHHAKVIQITGESYRLKDHLKTKND